MTPETELLVYRTAGAFVVLFGVWYAAVSVAWGRYSRLIYCFGPALLREVLDVPGHPLPAPGSLFFSEVGEYKVISPTEIRGRYARQSRFDMGVGTVRMCWSPGSVTIEGRIYPAWAVFSGLTSSTALAIIAFWYPVVPPGVGYPVTWVLVFAGFLAMSILTARNQARRLARDYLDGAVLPGAWSSKAAWQFEDPDDEPVARAPRDRERRAPRLPEYEEPFDDADAE